VTQRKHSEITQTLLVGLNIMQTVLLALHTISKSIRFNIIQSTQKEI